MSDWLSFDYIFLWTIVVNSVDRFKSLALPLSVTVTLKNPRFLRTFVTFLALQAVPKEGFWGQAIGFSGI